MKKFGKKCWGRLRAVRQRTWWKVFALLCMVWIFWYPKRMDALFMALPKECTVASHHIGLASEWKGFVNNPQIIGVLNGLGVKDARELKDNVGVYQTIFWLTGRHTVVGVVPGPFATSLTDLTDGYLAGASYVGWKAKIMELLWRIKWVPGLGRLQVTPSGTRYLAFEVDEAFGGVVFMGLDIADGILLASLSYNPEDVRALADRLHRFGPADAPARAFGNALPWKSRGLAPHTFWVSEPRLPRVLDGLVVEVSSLRKELIDLCARSRTTLPELAGMRPLRMFAESSVPGADLPADACGALFACDAHLATVWKEAFPLPTGDGVLVGSLTGKPFEGRLLGLAYPGLVLALPWCADKEFGVWATETSLTLKQLDGGAEIRTMQRTEEGASTLYAFPHALEVLGQASTRDMAFAEQRGGMLHIGTHYGSYVRQRDHLAGAKDGNGSVVHAVADWQRVYPDAIAVLRVDWPAVAREFKYLGAIAKLALPFFDGNDAAAQVMLLGEVVDTLQAFAPLGQMEAALSVVDDGGMVLQVGSAGRAPVLSDED